MDDTSNKLLSPSEAGQFLRVSTRTLEAWRARHHSPEFVKFGPRVIRHRLEALEHWLRVHTHGAVTARARFNERMADALIRDGRRATCFRDRSISAPAGTEFVGLMPEPQRWPRIASIALHYSKEREDSLSLLGAGCIQSEVLHALRVRGLWAEDHEPFKAPPPINWGFTEPKLSPCCYEHPPCTHWRDFDKQVVLGRLISQLYEVIAEVRELYAIARIPLTVQDLIRETQLSLEVGGVETPSAELRALPGSRQHARAKAGQPRHSG